MQSITTNSISALLLKLRMEMIRKVWKGAFNEYKKQTQKSYVPK